MGQLGLGRNLDQRFVPVLTDARRLPAPGNGPVVPSRDMTDYHHTQVARGNYVLSAVVLVLLVALARMIPILTAQLIIAAVCVVLAFASVMMSALTVTIADGALEFHFGAHVWGKTLPLSDIASAAVVRNSPLYGWGIHLYPGGWVYNVWGLDAVEVTRRNDSRFRLGSDEPGRLAAAIERAIASRGA